MNQNGEGINIFPQVRAQHGGNEVRVRFYNLTKYSIDIIWMRSEDEPTRYYILAEKQYLDIRTYEGHPWIFRRALDGAPMCVDQKTVFWPVSKGRNIVVRNCYFITPPMMTLTEIAARRMMLPDFNITDESISQLPEYLKRFLRNMQQERDAYHNAEIIDATVVNR